jgi:predicted RNA-binding Zn-ribbon protein involved in translation (DUF1610 family)
MDKFISREVALNLIEYNDKVCHYVDERYENVVYATTQAICKVVAEMPAAEVQPVKCSRWIPKNDGTYKVYCESCGHEQNPKAWDSDYKYCPNCGAEMKGESICY